MPDHIYDAIVVGAGPGGSAAAYYLAKQKRDVLLLDKSDFPRDKTCGDGLTPRALHVLDDMGILPEATAAGFRINGISLFGKRGASMRASIPGHAQYPDHLLVVPRFKLDDIVRRRALAAGAKFVSPLRVMDLQVAQDLATITGEQNGQVVTFRARVVILAIGANMGLLQQLHILDHQPQPIVAVRGYYENLQNVDDYVEAHFEEVPMPGYGWVFPISKTAANIGLGMWKEQASEQGSLRSAMQSFLNGPRLKKMTAGSKLVGVLKSYPLRIDFTSAPTFAERILLVGESAGLVSPLTGEGIDFALETGKMAAEFLETSFRNSQFDRNSLSDYDRLLRANFQSIFTFLGLLRRVYVNPMLMDRMIRLCERAPEIKQMFVNILMSQQHPRALLRPAILRQVLLGV
jgi:geranylgeranyl reductase family protein